MRTIPELMHVRLAHGVTTLACAWRVTRRDGAVFGFTDHDRDLVFEDVIFSAASALSLDGWRSDDPAADRGEASGAFRTEAITAHDLARGLWDGARVDLWRVDWRDVSQRVRLQSSLFGAVTREGEAFRVEMRGLDSALDAPFGRVFSRFCDADVGDTRCGVDLTAPAYNGAGVVAGVLDTRTLRVSGLGAFAEGWFARGRIVWASGGGGDVTGHRVSADAVTLDLASAAVFAVGDAFAITAGCDKRAETCRAKFSNLENFRGFPHMPGNDAVIAGPDPRTTLDGGSRNR